MGEEVCFLTVSELSELIKKKKVSPVEVTHSFLTRSDTVDRRINAYITLLKDEAINSSKEAEKAILAGNYLGPFHGIPVAHKDLFCTEGIRTTGGSKIFSDFVPSYDAGVVKRLKKAGAIMLGKLNTHEFGYGVTTQNPFYGSTRNPWDIERIPGGSSGGSGAAVAASLCPAATGNDGGGSIRIPASLCGIVGLKPTYGRVSGYGELPWVGASSVTHSGPMTKTVEDAALMMNILAGKDPKDPTTRALPVPDYTATLNDGVRGLKLGIPRNYFFERIDQEVEEAVGNALKVFEGLGASLEEVSLPHIRYAPAAALAVVLSEIGSAQEKLIRTRSPQDYGPDARMMAVLGQFILATDYLKAQRVRRLLINELEEVLSRVDVILTPTLPIPAVKIGQTTIKVGGIEESVFEAMWRFTHPFNLTGNPAISIPCGFSSSNLPIGLQIVGKAFDEGTVLKIARAYEVNTPWHEKRPRV